MNENIKRQVPPVTFPLRSYGESRFAALLADLQWRNVLQLHGVIVKEHGPCLISSKSESRMADTIINEHVNHLLSAPEELLPKC